MSFEPRSIPCAVVAILTLIHPPFSRTLRAAAFFTAGAANCAAHIVLLGWAFLWVGLAVATPPLAELATARLAAAVP